MQYVHCCVSCGEVCMYMDQEGICISSFQVLFLDARQFDRSVVQVVLTYQILTVEITLVLKPFFKEGRRLFRHTHELVARHERLATPEQEKCIWLKRMCWGRKRRNWYSQPQESALSIKECVRLERGRESRKTHSHRPQSERVEWIESCWRENKGQMLEELKEI